MINQQVLTTLFDELSDGVCLSDEDFKVFYLNPAARRMMGLAQPDLKGVTICELLAVTLPTPGLRSCIENCPLRVQRDKSLGVTQQADGLRIRCLELPHGILDARRPMILTFIEDNAAEIALQRHKEDWRHMVAHDLRSPLTVMLGTFDVLRDMPEGRPMSAAEKKLIETSSKAGARMMNLLNLYLDIAKLDAGLMPLQTEILELGPLVREAVEEQRPLAAAKRLAVSIAIPPNLLVRADAGLLYRVVSNVLNNAIKYSPGENVVSLTGLPISGGRVSLSVKDNGPGIDPIDLPHLFQRFFRASRRSGEVPGTGLGLTFCAQAMRSMDGRIDVVTRPGEGCDFVLQIPAA